MRDTELGMVAPDNDKHHMAGLSTHRRHTYLLATYLGTLQPTSGFRVLYIQCLALVLFGT